jgi:hypothetical protein
MPLLRSETISSRPVGLSLALMLATVSGGLTVRFAPLGLPPFFVKYGGSTLWALMVYWIVSTLLPSWRLPAVVLLTGLLATAVEFVKLYHSPGLDAFRLTLPGVMLLGRFFFVWDIVAYWLAIIVGAFADHAMDASETIHHQIQEHRTTPSTASSNDGDTKSSH